MIEENHTSPIRTRQSIDIEELKRKRRFKFGQVMTALKDKSRQPVNLMSKGLFANGLDPSLVDNLADHIPIKELLNCSVELYDLYNSQDKEKSLGKRISINKQ